MNWLGASEAGRLANVQAEQVVVDPPRPLLRWQNVERLRVLQGVGVIVDLQVTAPATHREQINAVPIQTTNRSTFVHDNENSIATGWLDVHCLDAVDNLAERQALIQRELDSAIERTPAIVSTFSLLPMFSAPMNASPSKVSIDCGCYMNEHDQVRNADGSRRRT